MPPWNWIIAAVASRAVSEAFALATDTARRASRAPVSIACAAYRTVCSAIVTATARSASACLRAWNEPTGTPNCTRSWS